MVRYRRIIADPFIDGPRPWIELRPGTPGVPDGISAIPGGALIAGPNRTFVRAGANQAGAIYIADINSLCDQGVYDPWYKSDTIPGIALFSGLPLNVLVPAGVSVTKDMGLTTNAVGWFVPATGGQRVIMFADETYNNNTGVYQHVRCRPNMET